MCFLGFQVVTVCLLILYSFDILKKIVFSEWICGCSCQFINLFERCNSTITVLWYNWITFGNWGESKFRFFHRNHYWVFCSKSLNVAKALYDCDWKR
jgi:hypothetical protein